MQFLPATFAAYGVATGGPGSRTDIAAPADAIYSVANYLAANGASDLDRLPAALLAYNHDPAYVHLVLAKAGEYATPPPAPAGSVPAGGDVQAVMDLAGQGRIGLPPEAATDLPSTDPRLVALMLEMGRRHSYTVSVIHTGHARCVGQLHRPRRQPPHLPLAGGRRRRPLPDVRHRNGHQGRARQGNRDSRRVRGSTRKSRFRRHPQSDQ